MQAFSMQHVYCLVYLPHAGSCSRRCMTTQSLAHHSSAAAGGRRSPCSVLASARRPAHNSRLAEHASDFAEPWLTPTSVVVHWQPLYH
jgi:hypothetical protein